MSPEKDNQHGVGLDTFEVASQTKVDTVVDVHAGNPLPKTHFNIWSCLGVNWSISATPIAIGTMLVLAIGVGGPPIFFYEFIFAGTGQVILAIAMAELASAIPHSTGPAYWVVALGPKKLGRILGYIMGWSTVACWFFISAVTNLFLAQLTTGLAAAVIADYAIKDWHTYLVYVAFALNAYFLALPKTHHIIGWILSASVVFINAAALFIFITLLVKASPKQSARTVFVDIVNETGWSSNVVVFFLSILPGVAAVGGIDSATHLADEMDNPGKQIPQVMIGSASLSFLTGIPSIIIFLFCTVDQEALLTPVGGQPVIQLFQDAYNSTPLVIISTVCIILSCCSANYAALVSWSRLYWSFSRDEGLPFSAFTAKLSREESIPVNALTVCTVLNILIGLLQLGASTALNALLGAASLCGKSSWALCFAMLFWRGRDALDKDRWLNLGKFGLPIDIIAFIWAIWVCVWVSFPLYVPVTARSMNYASVVFAGICMLSASYYVLCYSKKNHLTAVDPSHASHMHDKRISMERTERDGAEA